MRRHLRWSVPTDAARLHVSVTAAQPGISVVVALHAASGAPFTISTAPLSAVTLTVCTTACEKHARFPPYSGN